jgi:hypothetical protein
MPYADPAAKAANDRRRYRDNPKYFRKKCKSWREKRPRRAAYIDQRNRAKSRGVAWEITFEEWVEWWGTDIDLRGRQRFELQMCRYDDVGPYKLGNIYKATQAENDAGPRPYPEITF